MSDSNGDKPASDKKAPGFWFYTADYEKDVQILSLAAQGLWGRMLCWMSDNEDHRGFCEAANGVPLPLDAIAAKVGPTKIVAVAVRCMELGIEQWTRELRLNAAAPIPYTVSSAEWGKRNVQRDDEARARAAIEAAVQSDAALESQIQAERDEAASKLHLPGRRKATA